MPALNEADRRRCFGHTYVPEATAMHEEHDVLGGRCTLRLEPFAWHLESVFGNCDVLDGDAWCFCPDIADRSVQDALEKVVVVLRKEGDELLEVLC